MLLGGRRLIGRSRLTGRGRLIAGALATATALAIATGLAATGITRIAPQWLRWGGGLGRTQRLPVERAITITATVRLASRRIAGRLDRR